MPEESVSVIIPHYRNEQFLFQAVESIARQEKVTVSLFVVDDCSGTNLWLKQLKQYRTDPRIHLYTTSKRVGPYRIKNAVLPLIETPFVSFQDADDVSHAHRIYEQLKVLKMKKADIVGTSFTIINSKGEELSRKKMVANANFWLKLGKSFVMLPPSITLFKRVLDALHGFDGTTMVAADTDFIYRAAYIAKMRNTANSYYYYRKHDNSLTMHPLTGIGSLLRNAYFKKILNREKIRKDTARKHLDRQMLIPPPNDVDFDLIPVA